MALIRRTDKAVDIKLTDTVSPKVASMLVECSLSTILHWCDEGLIPHSRRVMKRAGGERTIKVVDLLRVARERNLAIQTEMLHESARQALTSAVRIERIPGTEVPNAGTGGMG